jgi:PAX-interacting protein 1
MDARNSSHDASVVTISEQAIRTYKNAIRSIDAFQRNLPDDDKNGIVIAHIKGAIHKDTVYITRRKGEIPPQRVAPLVSRMDFINDRILRNCSVPNLYALLELFPQPKSYPYPTLENRRLSTCSNASTTSSITSLTSVNTCNKSQYSSNGSDDDNSSITSEISNPFIHPRKKLATSPATPVVPKNIPLENKFNALNSEENLNNENSSEEKMDTNSNNPPPKNNKIDPIWIIKEQPQNWRDIVKKLKTELNIKIELVDSGNFIKIYADNLENFKKILNFVKINNIMSFNNNPKLERPLKIVVCGIPSDIPCSEVHADLTERGFQVNKCVQLRNYVTKKFYNKFLCHLAPNPKNNEIYHITELLGFQCNVEAYIFKGTKQCYRCLNFNHSSENCSIPYRCLKCGENHETKSCPKPKTTPPKCANCGGNHLANNNSCPANPTNIKKRKLETQRALNLKNQSKPHALPVFEPAPNPQPLNVTKTFANLFNTNSPTPLPQNANPNKSKTPSQSNQITETPQITTPNTDNLKEYLNLLNILKEIEKTLINIQKLSSVINDVNIQQILTSLNPPPSPNQNNTP